MYVYMPWSSNFGWESIQFQIIFITQIGHRLRVSNSNCSGGETRSYKKSGPHYDADATKSKQLRIFFSGEWYCELKGIYLQPFLRSF